MWACKIFWDDIWLMCNNRKNFENNIFFRYFWNRIRRLFIYHIFRFRVNFHNPLQVAVFPPTVLQDSLWYFVFITITVTTTSCTTNNWTFNRAESGQKHTRPSMTPTTTTGLLHWDLVMGFSLAHDRTSELVAGRDKETWGNNRDERTDRVQMSFTPTTWNLIATQIPSSQWRSIVKVLKTYDAAKAPHNIYHRRGRGP